MPKSRARAPRPTPTPPTPSSPHPHPTPPPKPRGPGSWAAKRCPPGSFTVFDIAKRIGLHPTSTLHCALRLRVPGSLLALPVAIAPGVIRKRRLRVFSQTEVERFLLRRLQHRV
jgi:hypothetical protein